MRLRLDAVAELAQTGQLRLRCGVLVQGALQLSGVMRLGSLLLLGLLPPLLSFLLVVALNGLQQVLDQGFLHRLTKLESLAEVASKFANVVPNMDSDPACLGWCHIHVDVKQQLLLLGLLETWRPHLRQLQPVIVFTPCPLLRLFFTLISLLLRLAHASDLLVKAIGQAPDRRHAAQIRVRWLSHMLPATGGTLLLSSSKRNCTCRMPNAHSSLSLLKLLLQAAVCT